MKSKEYLIMAGHALYGERWQTDLARDLGLPDGRRIRQWLSEDRPIPDGIWKDIRDLLKARAELIGQVSAKIAKIIPSDE